MLLALLLALIAARAQAPAAEVRAQIDWQAHPAMHIPWRMFGRGLTDRELDRRTWRHMLRQTVSDPALSGSGVRVFLAAAMAAERARNPRQARRLILQQLAYVEEFVARNPERYALARSPAEARTLLATTDRIVVIHSIEGGEHLLSSPGDAAFWAEKGVALVTLIHLRDREFGGSALLPGSTGRLINPRGARRERRGDRRGLTPQGEAAIVALDEAGILVDYSHMSPAALADALAVSAARGVPPVLTHGRLAPVSPGISAVTEDQLVAIYRMGGAFNLGLSALDVQPGSSERDACAGTLEAWAWQHQKVQETLLANAARIFGEPGLQPADLTEEQRTRLATGWSSDWNGWVSHSRPVYGRGECRGEAPAGALAIDTRGLAHPGLLPEHWARVQERGVSLDPMLRSAERFLQLWEGVRGERG